MKTVETNIFPIKNLEELSCEYALYKVKGLSTGTDDYDRNVRILSSRMTRYSNAPCVPIRLNGELYLAQPKGAKTLPEKTELELVRNIVKLECVDETYLLDFHKLDFETSGLALSFLYSTIRSKLRRDPSLWQPSSGGSFYYKNPDPFFKKYLRDIDVYRGFSVRPILLSNNRLGLCIDVHSKYVSRYPLPTDIDRDSFNKYKGMRCLYEYGNRWYEITIRALQDQNASELELPPDGISLYDHVHQVAGNRKPSLLQALPKDSSVLIYFNNEGQDRNVPSGLCRPVYGTSHPEISRHHRLTIKPPHIRREQIRFVVDKFLSDLHFNEVRMQLGDPIQLEESKFLFPDLEFGHNKVLSVRNSGTHNILEKEFSRMKKTMLYSDTAGIYTKKKFDKQYLIIPNSVLETFGEKLITDIKNEVNRLFSDIDEITYDPIIIPYDDSVQKSVVRLGSSILTAIEENKIDYGYAVVMIPEIPSKRMKKEDELANLVLTESRKRDLFVSIIHTKVSTDSYEYFQSDREGEWRLINDRKIQSKYRGYIQNVVLNKVLLLNSLWPFVLKTKLNSDLIIGIDVKNNTAGFTVIHQTGEKLSFYDSTSEQKERLSREHIRTKINEIIIEEQRRSRRNIKNIAIHRQGTLFPSEKKGVTDALSILAKQGAIDKNFTCTFVEVRTTSRMRYRLFIIENKPGRQEDYITNPDVGTYHIIRVNEAFICTTGLPYRHQGTSNPLHIIKHGILTIKEVIEDVFYLSNLTWTKIDDCSRLPISVKFADIRLREIAGDYDFDALQFEE